MKALAEVLVIDTGQSIIGVYSVKDDAYTPFQGERLADALRQIRAADVVVTYNGNRHDLIELSRFAGTSPPHRFPLDGVHEDMKDIIWSPRICGKSLHATYLMHFPAMPDYKDSYVGCNRLDVHLTFKLWQLWKQGALKFLDGRPVSA
jgi:hypothetical protein